MNLIQSNSVTISSIAFRDVVNEARAEFGESQVRNDQFAARVRDELGDELGVCKKIAHPQSGVLMDSYDLTPEQCMLVGMRESKAVRRSVLNKLKEMDEPKAVQALPDFSNPAAAARAWAEQFEIAQAVAIERDQAVATKAEIGNRREATAMNTASQAVKKVHALEVQLDHSKEYCTIKRMEMLKHGQKFEWRRLKSTCTEMGIPAIAVFDQNYGTVKSYHVDVWLEAYGIGLDD